jgi:hypothetical protein
VRLGHHARDRDDPPADAGRQVHGLGVVVAGEAKLLRRLARPQHPAAQGPHERCVDRFDSDRAG